MPTFHISWYWLAVITALIYGLHSVFLKAYAEKMSQYVVVWGMFAVSAPLLGLALWANGLPTVSPDFWWALAVSVSANLVAWPLFVRAVQISDVSLVMPLVAFTPAFILAVEFVLLGGVPGTYGFAGIILIIIGAYVLNVRGGLSGVLDPVRSLLSDRGAVYMCIVAAVWSISATVEKITVTASSPTFYLTFFTGSLAVLFVPLVWAKVDKPVRKIRRGWLVLVGAGGLLAAMAIVQMHSIQSTPLVNYVIAIKRAGMLVSVLFGWLLFSEKHMLFRGIGAVLMAIGVALIKLV